MYWQNRKDRVSEYICVRASGASERFLEFLIVLQLEKVNFFTINVKFKVILSSKGGGDICTGHPPPPTQKKWGGGYITVWAQCGHCVDICEHIVAN